MTTELPGWASRSGVEGLFQEDRWFVALADIGFQADSAICCQAIQHLENLLRQVDENLAPAFTPEPLKIGSAATKKWLQETTGSGREQSEAGYRSLSSRWDLLRGRRTSGAPAPQCVVVLSAGYLINSMDRDSLVESLMLAEDRYSSWLLIFLDETGSLLQPDIDAQQPEWWASAFSPLAAQCPVRLVLLSSTLETSRLISSDDLAQSVAMALLTDLIVSRSDCERLLTQDSLEPEVTLSTIGIRAVCFNPQKTVDRFVGRCLRDLLRRTVLAESRSTVPAARDFLKSAKDLVLECFPSENAFGSSIEIGDSSRFIDRSIPRLTGDPVRDPFELAVNMGRLTEESVLDKVPRDNWLAQLAEWDALVREDRLERIAASTSRELERAEKEQRGRLVEKLARMYVSGEAAEKAAGLCDQIRDLADVRYSVATVQEGTNRSLSESLDHLSRAFSQLAHRKSLFVRTGLLIGLMIWLMYLVAAWPSFVGIGLLIVSVFGTLCLSWLMYDRQDKAVRSAGGETLNDTARRAQRWFLESVQQRFETMRDHTIAFAKRYESVLSAYVTDTRELIRDEDQEPVAESPQSRLIWHMPTPVQEEELYHCFCAREMSEAGEGNLVARFQQELQAMILKSLSTSGDMSQPECEARLRDFVRRELTRFCNRFDLWNFLFNCIEGGAPDKKFILKSLQPLGDNFPFALLRGVCVEDGLLDPDRCDEFCISPLKFADYVPHNRMPLTASTPNFVALASRVDLVRTKTFAIAQKAIESGV